VSDVITWLLAFVAAYLAYTLFWGAASARAETTSEDFFLAGRSIPAWVFVLAATGTSLSAWNFAGLPGLVYAGGLPAATLALGTICTALGGVLFLKRQWIAARRHGDATQGQLLARYYDGEAVRLLGVLIALLFAVPFAGQQLAWAGQLIEQLSGGVLDRHGAAWVAGFALCLYVCFGGLRAVSVVGALQGMLVVAGLVTLGAIAYWRLGGFGALQEALSQLAVSGLGARETTASGHHPWFALPGVIQFNAGLDIEPPVGGPWTAVMLLSTGFALMGVQATPAFAQLAFGCRDLRGLAPQQVWAGAGICGLLLLAVAVPLGLGAHLAGADAALARAAFATSPVLHPLATADSGSVISQWIGSLGAIAPWWTALLAVCALAAVQLAVAVYSVGAATSLSIDVFQRFMAPDASDRGLRLAARLGVVAVLLLALLLGSFAPTAMTLAGALALGAAAQLLPALTGLCWWRWITRQGATLGLCAGLIAVLLTEPLGGWITRALGFELPWGRWPWTIHSAGWGLFFNVLICTLVSFATRGGEARARRDEHHAYLVQLAGASAPRRLQRPAVWAFALAWFFFAIGPGAVLGNDVFGAPGAGLTGWLLAVPSLWAWQALWWAVGVVVLWWMAYRMEMASAPAAVPLSAESTEGAAIPERGPAPPAPQWVRNFLGRVT
jgi:Na+/proline symporter